MVGESLDHNLNKQSSKFKQGVFSTTLEDLITKWNFPTPNYLKIDVDGIEHKIIKKSKASLKNKELDSILIEISPNREKDQEIINTLLYYDFIFDKKQVDNSTRIDGPHKDMLNIIFIENNLPFGNFSWRRRNQTHS